jgi:D-threo-aldose 1-dehydrogenase
MGIVDIDIVLIHDIGRVTHGENNARYWRQLSNEGGFRALDELRASRGVKAVGLGVNEGAAIQEVMAEYNIDCALLAGRYTLLEQAVLDDLLPECEKRGVSIVLGGAFNSGILARGLKSETALKADNQKFNYGDAPPLIIERVEALERVCREHGVALSSAALQFPYAHKVVATVLMGARNPEEVRLNAAAFAVPLPDELWDALRAAGLLHHSAPVPRMDQAGTDHADSGTP